MFGIGRRDVDGSAIALIMLQDYGRMASRIQLAGELTVQDLDLQQEQRASRLKKALKAAGTVQKVSHLSGVPKGTLNQYLRGGEMKLSTAIALADATGVCLEWLATGRGPMRPGEAQKTATSEAFSLEHDGDMEALEAAYSGAIAALAARGRDTQHPPAIARIMAILYDELRSAKSGSRNR